MVQVKSETFTIDRTKWGINYGSKSIFDNLGDKFIDDDMEITIDVTAVMYINNLHVKKSLKFYLRLFFADNR